MSRRFDGKHHRKITGLSGSSNVREKNEESSKNNRGYADKKPDLKSLMDDWLSTDKQDVTTKAVRKETVVVDEHKTPGSAVGCDEDFPSLSDVSKKGAHLRVDRDQTFVKEEHKSQKTEYLAWGVVNRHQKLHTGSTEPNILGTSRRQQSPPVDDAIINEDFPSLSQSATHKVHSKDDRLKFALCNETSNCNQTMQPDDRKCQCTIHKTAKHSGRNKYTSTNTRWNAKTPSKGSLLSDYINLKPKTPKTPQTAENAVCRSFNQRGTITNKAVPQKDVKEDRQKLIGPPKIESELLTIGKVQELKGSDAGLILFTLTQENSGFDLILNKSTLPTTDVCLIMELVAKACSDRAQPQCLFRLLLDLEKSPFCSVTLPQALAVMTSEVEKNTYEILKTFVENILGFLIELASRMPHAIILISGLHTFVDTSLKSLTKCEVDLPASIEMKMQQLAEMKRFILKKMETDRLKANRVIKSDTSPNDFRAVCIMPTYDDVYPTKLPFLRKIKTTGGYSDLNEYLDIQFRLLREDFIQPLRQGVREYLIAIQNPRQHVSVRTYHKVRVLMSGFNNDKFVHTVTFDTSKLRHIQWEHTKRLIYGTLVCLSNDNFKTFSIATVESGPKQQKDNESKVTLDLFIEHVIGEREIDLSIPMVMVETTAYFEAYRYVLASLQNIREGQLPFEEYIVHCKTDVKPPSYLQGQPKIKYNFVPVSDNSYKVVETKRNDGYNRENVLFENSDDSDNLNSDNDPDSEKEDVVVPETPSDEKSNDAYECVDNDTSILQLDSWPQPDDLHLDVAQFKAFQQALTKEFVIMQGPPGTGKTYVGLKIVKMLLSNAKVWQKDDPRPMLVLCYTNHALDQFLEGILSFYRGTLVRVGGRCSNEKVQPYGIKELRRTSRVPRHFDNLGQIYVMCQNSLLRTQKHIKMLNDGIVKSFYLVPLVKKSHYDQLTLTQSANDGLLNWLDLQLFALPNVNKKGKGRHVGKMVDCNALEERQNTDITEPDTVMDEGEAAIAEAERKIDVDENFEKLFKTLQMRGTDILSLNLKKILKNSSRKQSDDFLQKIKSESRMTKDEEMAVHDIWSIPNSERWRLYRLWVHQLKEHLENEMVKLQKECIDAREEYRLAKLQTDKAIMRTRSVIGMTTSGAARYQKVLSEIKPRIIVIEEAAEVLEGHVIASLSSECQHLILIGDHQQLRPSTNVYTLAKQYNLELSLFERMVKNGLQCICLEKQHRMRPSISRIMKHIYPDLRDDASVLDYPNILGVCSNVFFISHSVTEQKNNELISHLNIFEAKYVIALCLYLIKQGYSPSKITILTTYSAQVAYLKQNMPKETFHGVRVTAVDNYQGEENDIILLSLVRSNLEGNVGFLKIDNRVCVALSRAKQGLYVIGNFELLSKQSDLWKNIIDDLKPREQVGHALRLYCQNHQNDSGIKASKPEDFLLAPEGGCMKDCLFQLKCGHVCASRCHPVDPHHLQYKCMIPCEKVIPACQHTQTVPCSTDAEDVQCVQPVLHKGKCGHDTEVPCFTQGSAPCLAECNTILKCGHTCRSRCYECVQGRLHVPCTERCNKILICGHECRSRCSICLPCQLPCDRCPHRTCHNGCSDPCMPCNEPCPWICKDKKCTNRCSDVCNREACNKKCPRILKCGHRCIGLCGEKCPALCKKCNKDEIRTWFMEKGNNSDVLFVELDDCGHIVEVETLDKIMEDREPSNKIQLKQCPWCKTRIRHSLRYGESVKKTIQDINEVKIIMMEEQHSWKQKEYRPENEDVVSESNQEENDSIDEQDDLSRSYEEDSDGLEKEDALSGNIQEGNSGSQRLDTLFGSKQRGYGRHNTLRGRDKTHTVVSDWIGTASRCNEETTLYNNAVQTIEGVISVRNQIRFLNAVYQISQAGGFYGFDAQHKQFTSECDIFKEWIINKRKVFTEQEASDANNELQRLRLFIEVNDVEKDYRMRKLSAEEREDLELVKLYLSDGNPYTPERQQKVKAIMSGIMTKLGLRRHGEEIVVDMPTTFTDGHWIKCTEGHIFYGGNAGGDVACSQCSVKLEEPDVTIQEKIYIGHKTEGGSIQEVDIVQKPERDGIQQIEDDVTLTEIDTTKPN
ncbi:NFX1-type zinc finger-containing protein 1-like [Gigantopelta aegis]|uniref:NFX1-type zinc finger-containing protein 1-like n=1 Tax=Gigantopelta aegis TaxID=1735272 RepID=UPI001B88DB08|nr:NFX1-type zinc finger-containing protein 1-like [Gigantopelta aegis]